MKSTLCVAVFGTALLASAGLAGQTAPLPKGQMPDLGRPTKVGDELPLFNFDEYFPGKWTFEWDVPEGALGPSGRITGTTIYKAIDAGKFFEAITEAAGPGGAFTLREMIAYQRDTKTLARHVTDSRGFSFLQAGTIGGDLGGLYTIYFDGAPFTYNGKTVRIKHAMRLLSPLNYKVSTTVSVNGGPFTNYGNPWWRKHPTGTRD
jgi:hypothetical protein